ncbi:hypothetical protein [Deinococcus actinosclerus]|uniref:DUF11 domain-containing protein n=1 Tax=Deinococcus actinosclerus TaxID=1768108 RepID=A0ABM5X265_9DEIO|nr:hypothetical protein [Deinococcus actinosclerus]ALW87787.1 hypothetical protein AUC44_01810 [Deinococcus actinosclerus]
MKKSHLIALMTALAAGTAAAAPTLASATNTPAGTTIENIASATFQDPGNPTGTPLTSTSNKVTTTVLPKPGFDVVYTDGTADGNTIATTPVLTTGAVPGQKITTAYSVVNNGNVTLTVALAADTTGAAAGQTVQYFLADASGNPTGAAITSLTLPVNDPATATDEGIVKIVQVVTLPTDPVQITTSSIFGASPEASVLGTAGADPLVTPGNGYASGTTTYEDAKPENTDLQFVRITVFAPALDNNPNTNPGTPVDSAGNAIPSGQVPPYTTVQVPTEVVGKPGDNTPVVDASGYVTPGAPAGDPTPGGTPIVPNVATDNQVAYPKADANNANDVVLFTNNLTNTSGATDKVQLFPVLADGTPDTAYVYNATTGTFTNAATGVSIRFLDPVSGAVILASTDPSNPTLAKFPTVTVPDGKTVVYRTEVTYPDANDSDPISPIVVKIGADSLNDADLKSDSATTDTINPPAAQFGDATTALGASSTPFPVQTVTPNGTFGGVSSPDLSDATAVFPMDVVNNGQYNDSFTLSGSVTFTDAATNNTVTVPVLYYAPDGSLLPRVSNDPASADYNKFITPVIAPGTEYKPLAVINVPSGTVTATNPSGYTAKLGDYLVDQTAVGNYSTISMTDTNDIVRVSPNGNVAVAKFVAKTGVAAGSNPVNGINNPADYTATGTNGAKPLDDIAYRIIGKNNYNAAVPGFFLTDTVPVNTTFKSVQLLNASGTVITANVIYRVGTTGAWSTVAPAAGAASGTVISVALDADNNGQPDALPASGTLTAQFVVTVK